jgi:hypothetical protein
LAGRHLDQLAPLEDSHQGPVSTHVDTAADQVARHRVEGVGDFDVMVAMDLRRGVDRHVETLGRCRQQTGPLLDGEHLHRSALGGAMDAHPGPLPAPHLNATLSVGEINERLTGEE